MLLRILVGFVTCFCLLVSTSNAQRSYTPYPIIFVHGLLGNDKVWNDATSGIASIYGDAVPSRQDEIGTVLHAMLNRYKQMTSIFGQDGIPGTGDDDVYVNPRIPLASGVYIVNFENSWNEDPANPILIPYTDQWIIARESQSNQSAVVKQGYALQQFIRLVLQATGAKKVILVGHSMGGIAIREYLQHRQNGVPRWWVDPTKADGHCVAKVVTIASPHRGSDILKWVPLLRKHDEETPQVLSLSTSSEAIRDLRISYATGSQRIGVYLFGGNEAGLNTNWLLSGWHNADVDCNGRANDIIEGINPGLTGSSPLPDDVRYSYVVARYGQLSGDLLIDSDRQYVTTGGGNIWPIGRADTMHSTCNHWTVTSDIPQLMRALDEPSSRGDAYEIEFGMKYRGAITQQSGGGSRDVDMFKLVVDTAVRTSALLRFYVRDSASVNRRLTWSIITSTGDTLHSIQTNATVKQQMMDVPPNNLPNSSDALYLVVTGDAIGAEWMRPYEFEVARIGPATSAPSVRGLTDTTITQNDTLFDAFTVTYDNVRDLAWSVTSSDTLLISSTDVVISGAGSHFTARITPRANRVGTAILQIRCADAYFTKTADVTITVVKDTVIRNAPVVYGLRDTTIRSARTHVDEFRVVYSAIDRLRWDIASSDTTVIPLSGITLLIDSNRFALQVKPRAGVVGSSVIRITCSDSTYTGTSSIRITVVRDSLPSKAPAIFGVVDAIVHVTDTLFQDVRVIYDDPDNLKWVATSLDTSIIPTANVALISGGDVNVLRVIPRSGIIGTAVIRVLCRDSSNTSMAEMRVTVIDDTVTSVHDFANSRVETIGIWPTPTLRDNAFIVLHASDEHAIDITILDHAGRTVSTFPLIPRATDAFSYPINTSSLPSGRYYLHLRTDRRLHIAPLIITR